VRRLADLKPGQSAVIAEVSDHNPALLRYLGELGLYPQAKVNVLALAPFGGPLTIRVGENEHSLGQEVAAQILMADVSGERQ
jgi:DtxR family Mn-dependent transcriptional regulator